MDKGFEKKIEEAWLFFLPQALDADKETTGGLYCTITEFALHEL
jgi:hypothetical protein